MDHIAKTKSDWSWFTLTAHENSHKADDKAYATLNNIRRAWDRLIKRMKRKHGRFSYVRVYEHHASGNYHLHCIRSGGFGDIVTRNRGKVNEYKDSKWLRQTARKLGMGYMTHAEDLEFADRAVFYVTKYMTKTEAIDRHTWGAVRRIQTSRDIKRVTEESDLDWRMSSGLFIDELEKSISRGMSIFNVTEKRRMTVDDFEGTRVYPK